MIDRQFQQELELGCGGSSGSTRTGGSLGWAGPKIVDSPVWAGPGGSRGSLGWAEGSLELVEVSSGGMTWAVLE